MLASSVAEMNVIRIAAASDADGCRTIDAPIGAETAISFEEELPDRAEMERSIEMTLARLPGFSACGRRR